jgi:hypothetical protein
MQREMESAVSPTVSELLVQFLHTSTPVQFLYLPAAQGAQAAPLSAMWLRRPPPPT